MIVIAAHAVFLRDKDIYGPPHAVSLYLNKKKRDHIFIKHRLFTDKNTSIVERYEKGKLVSKKEVPVVSKPYIRRLLSEVALNRRIIKSGDKPELYIGVNPINSAAGALMKLQGEIQHNVYFCADFAIKRFDNPAMNRFYHMLDWISMKGSEKTWSISKRIVQNRDRRGLAKHKNLLLPNAPFFDDIKRRPFEKIHPHDLVLVSALEPGIAFETVIETVSKLSKKFKDIRLILIGAGSQEGPLKKLVKEQKLEKRILFKGPLPHDDMFDILTTCGVGIALYDVADPNHFRYFSDPMKVRDYLASGLPAIVSGNSAIGEEIRRKKAGFVVQANGEDLERALVTLMSHKKTHQTFRENAIKLAKTYDTYALIDTYIKTA